MLKAGILEIGDVFVVNKADLAGANKTVQELRQMLDMRDREEGDWDPRIVETVATDGTGLAELLAAFEDHVEWLNASGRMDDKRRERYASEIRTLLRDDASALMEREIDAAGGMDHLVERVVANETNPYAIAEDIVGPLADCVDRHNG